MRKILTITIISLLFAACGSKEQSVDSVIASKDLTTIRAKKDALDKKQQELAADIKLLNDEISKLDTNKKIPLITTIIALEKPFVHYLELQGSVQTKKNVLVYPEMPGQLVRIYVKEGQKVVRTSFSKD